MKKKLIAIVASLAMVATMVPATAFAEGEPTEKVKVDMAKTELQIATAAELKEDNALTAAQAAARNANIWATYANGTLKLAGSVPYQDRTGDDKFSNTTAELNKGHFVSLNLTLPRVSTPTSALALLVPCTTTKAIGGESKVLTGQSFKKMAIGSGDGKYNNGDLCILDISLTAGKNKTFSVYFLQEDGAGGAAEAAPNGSNLEEGLYLTATELAKLGEQNVAGNIDDLQTALRKADGDVVGSKQLTVNTSGVTLLSASETKSMEGFVAAVKRIDETQDGVSAGQGVLADIDDEDTVNPAYKQAAVAAKAIYAGLGDKLKGIVDDAVAASAATGLKAAYKALETAEANVKSYDTLTAVAALVAALPAADKLDLADAAAIKQINDAQAAVEALTKGAQDVLLDTEGTNEFLTVAQINNYESLKTKINDAAVKAVIDAIEKLPTLPTTAFADKAAVDAAYAPMVAAEQAMEALTKEQKGDVTNKLDLEDYRTAYDKLIKAYVDPIYEEAAAINLEEALTAENIALITELKAYVEGEYIATKNIAKFDQATYDALVAALNKIEKDDSSLENATIAAIADQAYTGAAIEPAVTVTDKAGKEVPADDYTVIYSNNKDAGTATVTVAAKSSSAYTGSVSATFIITPATLTDAMVKSVANATYTGKAVTPAVTVEKGVTYDVAYSNNTAVGKATATITGTGNYTGTITKDFIVKPATEAISSLKAGKKSLTVAYKAQTGAKYRIVYSPAKGQAKAVNTTATKKTIKSLKAGKTYKVKVRAYKVVDGKTYNGTYSTVKKVKVK